MATRYFKVHGWCKNILSDFTSNMHNSAMGGSKINLTRSRVGHKNVMCIQRSLNVYMVRGG